jgi:hypothetical protein
LTEVLGDKFAGTGVTDDYAAYDSIFTRHQLSRSSGTLVLINNKRAFR